MKRGGSLRRLTPLVRRTALCAQSAKHAREERVLARVKLRLIERAGYRCEAHPILGPCDGPLHAHHILRRSQGGTHTLENLALLCRYHHAWVHEHPAEAEVLGLLRRPESRNAKVTVTGPSAERPSYLYGWQPPDTEPAA